MVPRTNPGQTQGHSGLLYPAEDLPISLEEGLMASLTTDL